MKIDQLSIDSHGDIAAGSSPDPQPSNRFARVSPGIRRNIDHYFELAWHDMDIRGIGKPQVFAVLDAMMDRGTEVSANRCLATMRRLFNWCVERGYLDRSPAAGESKPVRRFAALFCAQNAPCRSS